MNSFYIKKNGHNAPILSSELQGIGSYDAVYIDKEMRPSGGIVVGNHEPTVRRLQVHDDVCLVLGDNIFYGADLPMLLKKAAAKSEPTVFGYRVSDPERYGVVEFDASGKAVSLEEKPVKPKSNYAVVGLYFYPNDVVVKAVALEPSARGEYEITDLNREYLNEGRLTVETMGRGFAWLDTGTHQSLADATNFVRALIERQGLQISCIEEIAWSRGWIDDAQLIRLAGAYGKSSYGAYLGGLVKEI